MKVLITGITGFIGKRLAIELFKNGHDIVALARNPNRVRDQLAIPVKSYFWDGSKTPPPAESLQGVEVVINLAGEPIAGRRWTEEYKRALYESRVLAARNLAKGVRDHCKSCQCFLSASAVGFYGDRGEEILTESSPSGLGFLSELCSSWEKEVAEQLPASVRQIFLRIGVVLGRNGGALDKILPPFRAGLGGPIGSGNQWMSWIHIDDLLSMVIWCLSKTEVRGPINATAPLPVRNSLFSGVLAHSLKRPALMRVPEAAMAVVMGESARLVFDSQRVLPAMALEKKFNFLFPDIESALKEIVSSVGITNAKQKQFLHFLPKSIEQLFKFFSDEKNLESITPPWLHFKVRQKTTESIGQGTLINYTLKIRGFPVSWRTEITEWNPPQRFCDTQLKGPYNFWHHEHIFEACPGGTLMTDRITYRLPFGNFGQLIAGALVAKDIEKIFAYRRKAIERIFVI